MKKLLLFVLLMMLNLGAAAQTYKESKKAIDLSIKQLEKKLDKINELMASYKDLPKYFTADNLKNLNEEKNRIETALIDLKKLDLQSSESYLNQSLNDGINYDVPKEMSRREYNRRSRALIYKISEDISNGQTKSSGFEGLLINYKTGINEVAIITISRADIKTEVTTVSLKPGERLSWLLMPGDYKALVICGDYSGEVYFKVNPHIIKYCDGQPVYWFVCKTMSDF